MKLAQVQPKGGYMHKDHLLAHGPLHMKWSAGKGWQESNEYCIAPSSALYERKLVR